MKDEGTACKSARAACPDRYSHRALAVACEGADARSSATWFSARPRASGANSISRRAGLEFPCERFGAHGYLRPGEVYPVGQKPESIPLAGIRIPYRIRIFRQLDVWRRPARPSRICSESGHAPFRLPCGERLPPVLRIRV